MATVVTQQGPTKLTWVLLSYRIPREPSTPRIAVWRKLKALGVGQVGDGLVALPDDARNREQLEWVAGSILEANGEVAVWVATTSTSTSTTLASQMRAARNDEYAEVIDEVATFVDVDPRTLSRLRRTLRRINRRDHFRAPLRDRARIAVDELTAANDDVVDHVS